MLQLKNKKRKRITFPIPTQKMTISKKKSISASGNKDKESLLKSTESTTRKQITNRESSRRLKNKKRGS